MATITQLRAFHAVAASKGFSQAARETTFSQPNLSGQVRQLEAAAGFALFERRPHGVTLTPEGEDLQQITARLVALIEEAESFLKSRRSDGGHLRLASDGVNHALPVLQAMRADRPHLTFALKVLNSDAVLDQILQYRADVGISAQVPQDPRFHTQPFMTMRLRLMLPVAHPWAKRSEIDLRELAGESFVLRERGSRTREAFERALSLAGVELGRVVEISTREGVREAVAHGFGLGVVADRDHVPDPRLSLSSLSGTQTALQEYLICLAERRRVPLIQHFLRCAAADAEVARRQ